MAEAEELKEEPGQEHEQQQQQQQQQQAQEQERESEGTREAMKPWEQHSAVISIPRFDYNAPSSLLHHSHSGFLITCPIKREKSATKEAISILDKYIEANDKDCLEDSDASENVKKRKLCLVDGEAAATIKCVLPKDESPSVGKTDNFVKHTHSLSLVKVTGSGLLLLTFPKGSCYDPVGILSQIYQSLELGALKRPLWCNRIFPIQATCRLEEKEVSATVSNLVRRLVNEKNDKLSRPLKFAVGYNRRRVEETEMKAVKNKSSDPNICALVDRNKCFSIVAAAVKEVVSESVVDLKSPELCVLIELLPLAAVPNGSLIAAVSVLPGDLVTVKPRLCVKALVSDPKARKEES